MEEVLSRVKRYRDQVDNQMWIIGRGFNEEQFDVPVRPDRKMLDEISKERPISLTRSCGHLMAVNSKALEIAGIDENTQVEGGRIDFMHGIIEGNAIELVHSVWPAETVESIMKYIERGAKELNRYGITACGTDDFMSVTHDWKMVLDAFLKLSYQEKLHVRAIEQCEFETSEELAHFLDDGYTTGVGDEFFRIGPLKLIADGSLGARSAAMSRPYHDDPENKGTMRMSRSEMDTWIRLASQYNMPSIVHCIGDRALEQVLNLFDHYVLEDNPLHFGIVHCQIMRPEQIARILKMKLDCYFQSLFIEDDAAIVEARCGKKLASASYPYRTLFEGTLAANGSDAPVEVPNPLLGIQLAVTRKTSDGSHQMNPSECLTVEQAIDSYTGSGIDILQLNDITGRRAAECKGDFTVLDTDITECAPEEIGKAKVLMTVVNGETVFEI
ncbi:MAG: amidohydrolase [Erysipelotrichia bacterium]|nr:amidohydrolase [Erysipelotrichia bacterium]